ncbi:MAG: LPS export ABC transporter periplasmic protein LptC [Ferrovum sp. 37-45-19]|uniref:LPS export ABC transporter periplasmic protein LptC n=1 Tax=Ferrovum sp. JA12 TaxID=1356299 RepID=UPI0007025508|nr:LPS export ABC transporter periplasmic protein LptC [Ferrovum sp. JA12]OYV79608.1 MAG: LPS export ABC transporter periplasmic protein LptC [Ferrovum sp. 21-44-67]OYV94597.1 MAG: LPS export ABC transporter periplasmic protein LptC [Ferrovum sp. 37-45-19]OZB34576.1 MAG: LPS export ABC transporter periplasmic protein LptC [Ferrovum sp. 34-44-207]HQT81533.1 LPS export ABC transporter periplasmic protein LptC [Ferrovaceae bacterium]KRH79505.1 lipopolysaccharide exporter periplasmic protein [Ferr
MARITQNIEALGPLVITLLMALVTGWLWRVVEHSEVNSVNSKEHKPDILMSHFMAQQLDEKGRVHYTLNAHQMTHYPDDSSSYFNHVLFTTFEPKEPPVTVQSAHAVRFDNLDKIIFTGDVVVTRRSTIDQPTTILRTQTLTVYLKKGIGETDQPVVITYGINILTAASMKVNTNTKIAEFGHAKATYYPKKSH